MMSNQAKILRSKISDHKREKQELIPPFAQFPMSQVYWHKELLPEFLWIDSLVAMYGEIESNVLYNSLLDILDDYNVNPSEILLGTVSTFSQIDQTAHSTLKENNKEMFEIVINKPFGDVIDLYPEHPMSWLVKDSKYDQVAALRKLTDSVERLYLAKDSHSGFCRALPLNRFFKHNKLQISAHMEDTIKAIEEYPYGDRYRLESFARTLVNMELEQRKTKNPNLYEWSKYFWNYNRKLSECI